jgi:hypothetical protein
MKCPCCSGSGEIEDGPPTQLSPLQRRIWEVVRRSDGIAIGDLIDRIYASTKGGGPANPSQTINTTVHNANKRLAIFGQKIVSTRGPGSLYSLQHLDNGK